VYQQNKHSEGNIVKNADSNMIAFGSQPKSVVVSNRKDSTENCDSFSDSKSKESVNETPAVIISSAQSSDSFSSPEDVITNKPEELKLVSSTKKSNESESTPKVEEDPDFLYKMPRKHKFEYNKRKDVILKTILRKCRRALQDEFNDLSGYFQNRKMQGHQFLKDSIMKYHDSITGKPQQLDLAFYLAAILYPQEMSRGVDCFFECDKEERVKNRKFYRAKIQKVHDVLYRYSHERMDYFVRVPELAFIYGIFYKKEILNPTEDQYYMNGATEIFQRCKETLEENSISI
jgi:hypothetical protein